MELQNNYQAFADLDAEIIAIAQEESDPSTLRRVESFVGNRFPIVADPKKTTWDHLVQKGISLVDKDGVIRLAMPGVVNARPRVDLLIQELAAISGSDHIPEVVFGGAETNGNAQSVDSPDAVLSHRAMWSHDYVSPGDPLKLAFMPIITKGYHVYAWKEEQMSPFKVEIEVPDGLALKSPIGYPEAHELEEEALGKTFQVYEGPIPLSALVFEAGKELEVDRGLTVAITLSFQACDDSSCFPPASKRFEFSIPAKAKTGRRGQVFGWRTW